MVPASAAEVCGERVRVVEHHGGGRRSHSGFRSSLPSRYQCHRRGNVRALEGLD